MRAPWLGLVLLLGCQPCPRLAPAREVRTAGPGPELCALEPDAPGCLSAAPRCSAGDPGCLPVPGPKYDACYRPDAARKPLQTTARAGGDCRHDGECVALLGGCAKACVNYRAADPFTMDTCELPGWLEREDLLCGCVAGSCSWFTQ